MPDSTKKDVLFKFVYNTLEAIVDNRVLSFIDSQCSKNNTPILYSIVSVWHEGQKVLISEDSLYKMEPFLIDVYKKCASQERFDLLLEFFRYVIIEELNDLSLYMDISEKLSVMAIFLYIWFYDENIIQPLLDTVHIYIVPEKSIIEFKDSVVAELEGNQIEHR